MKQETRELIDWIKIQLNNPLNAADFKYISNLEKIDKAISFLDSLPEIESHLCRGGYIQDCAGGICYDGDLICILTKDFERVQCVLEWDSEKACFFAHNRAMCEHIPISELNSFQKWVNDGTGLEQ